MDFYSLCSHAEFMRNVWERYDAQCSPSTSSSTTEETGSKVFTSLVSALKRLVTEKPSLLGVSQQMMGVGVIHGDGVAGGSGSGGSGGALGRGEGGGGGGVAGMVSATVSGVVGMMGTEAGLSFQASAMKLQWYVFFFRYLVLSPFHRLTPFHRIS